MRMTKGPSVLSLGVAALFLATLATMAPAAVRAFPYTWSWHTPVTSNKPGPKPGAGGIYGTGGARDWGITCAHCHPKAPGIIDATLTPVPSWTKLGAADAYSPGTTYQITVTMTGEHLGLGKPANENGMNLTVEDVNGRTVGVFTADTGVSSASCPPAFPAMIPATGTTYVYGDCHGILPLQKPNLTSWKFSWRAPAAGTGEVTFFYGVVDGSDSIALNDDVKIVKKKLVEGP